MPKYSRLSNSRLDTCDERLQELFRSIVKDFDNKILYGHRTPEKQFELFRRGRRLENGIWVIENKHEIVTYKDGIERLSMHNLDPALAVDAVPYPVDWPDTDRMYYFAGMVMERARNMCIPLRWGGDFDMDTETKDEAFVDLPHFEIMAKYYE